MSENGVDLAKPPKSPLDEEEGDGWDFNVLRSLAVQRVAFRWLLIVAGLAVILVLMVLFCCFTIVVLDAISVMSHKQEAVKFDWHILMLGSLMIVPATVVLLVFAKAVFRSPHEDKKDDSDTSNLPLAQFMEEVFSGLFAALKSIVEKWSESKK